MKLKYVEFGILHVGISCVTQFGNEARINQGPGLYYVDNEGNRLKGNVFSVGSGSVFALGILDTGYKWDLTDKEAHELGRRAICHATHRDAYSGGIIRVYHVKEDGWKKISEEDCKDLFYKYFPLK